MKKAAHVVLFALSTTWVSAEEITLTPLQRSDSLAPFIIGGAPADPALWPVTLILSSPARCTATVVGPRAVLTAAHCLTGTSAIIELDRSSIAIECTKHSDFESNKTADIAMCKSTSDLKIAGPRYETINLDPNAIRPGNDATILGFGCLIENGTPSDILYIGSVTITKGPTPADRDYELHGGAKLCAGDSGGAAYRVLNMRSRKIFGVQSSQTPGTRTSYASSTAIKENADFIKSWAAANSIKVCGIDSLPTCR